MNNHPKRVLHITEMLSAAGIESFIMNIYRNINRDEVQFDFLVLRNQQEFYDEEIASLGGKKYYVHSNVHNTFLRILDESKKIEDFLKKNHYDIVHVHYTTPLRAYYLKAAKRANVPVRIYHSHSAKILGKSKFKLIIYNHCKKVIDKYATDFFACSKAASQWMYSENTIKKNKVQIIYNGIDTKRFLYNEVVRERVRNKYFLEDDFVIIHTGRFSEQKNQLFIIDIFNEVKKKKNNAKLFLLGEGILKKECIEKVKQYKLEDDVFFMGVRQNVQDYLFASDCYVMPSLYEGLPVAGVEAECTGLTCIFSNNITDEVQLNDNVVFLSLDYSAEQWATTIIERNDVENRSSAVYYVKKAGYDIYDVTKKIQRFYLKRGKNV